MDEALFPELVTSLRNRWGLEVSDNSQESWESLKQYLHTAIHELIQRDFHQLLNAMYRLDISESAFNAALALPDDHERVSKIVDLILTREMQRLETLRRYRNR